MTKQPPDTDSGLVHVTKALGIAMSKYRQAAEVAEVAIASRDAALIELNACQERVDQAIESMKLAAPPESRWRPT